MPQRGISRPATPASPVRDDTPVTAAAPSAAPPAVSRARLLSTHPSSGPWARFIACAPVFVGIGTRARSLAQHKPCRSQVLRGHVEFARFHTVGKGRSTRPIIFAGPIPSNSLAPRRPPVQGLLKMTEPASAKPSNSSHGPAGQPCRPEAVALRGAGHHGQEHRRPRDGVDDRKQRSRRGQDVLDQIAHDFPRCGLRSRLVSQRHASKYHGLIPGSRVGLGEARATGCEFSRSSMLNCHFDLLAACAARRLLCADCREIL